MVKINPLKQAIPLNWGTEKEDRPVSLILVEKNLDETNATRGRMNCNFFEVIIIY